MTINRDYRHNCPNCGALTQLGAVICSSCGVNLLTFHVARSKIEEAKTRHIATLQHNLAIEHEMMQTNAAVKNRIWLSQTIRLILISGVFLIILTIVGTGWIVWTQHQIRLELQAEYDAGLACIEQSDYLCTRNHMRQILDKDEDFPGALSHLVRARYLLAEQYIIEHQWVYAVEELELLLTEQPGHLPSLALRRKAYDEWIKMSMYSGDIFLALKLRTQRDRPVSE